MCQTTVLFACVQNAGRSQMAAALFNQAADSERARAISAGSRPADRVHSVVVAAMSEVGVDLEGIEPRLLTADLASQAGVIVTMGCGEECPVVPGARYLDWDVADPAGQGLDRVRETRAEIQERVRELVTAEGWI